MITENLIYGWVLFGCLGMIYWGYGKMKDWWQPKALAVALSIFPYFVSGEFWLWTVGGVLASLIFFTRD